MYNTYDMNIIIIKEITEAYLYSCSWFISPDIFKKQKKKVEKYLPYHGILNPKY